MNNDTLPPPGDSKPTVTKLSSKNNTNNTNSNSHSRYNNNKDRHSNGPTRGKTRDNRETKENNHT